MNTDLIRVYKSVHTWTGILSGLALFIAFYAGAITVFKEPLVRWASPPGLGQVDAVTLEEASGLVVKALKAHPEAGKDLRLHLKPAEHLSSRVSWQVRDEGSDDHGSHDNHHYTATLDAEGELITKEAHPSQLGEFIDTLHRVVGLPFDTEANRWIMGVIASLYVFALVSGVIVLLPTLVKDFFALRLGKNLKRMWLDAHNVVGIVSLPMHLLMALTAVVFAFHDPIYLIQDKLIHEGGLRQAFQSGLPRAAPDQPIDPVKMLPATEMIAKVQVLSPTFEPYMLQYVGVTTPRAQVRVWGRDQHTIVPRAWGGFAPVNPYTGEVMSLEYMPVLQSGASATLSSLFSLHFASYGGDTVRWIYFLLALAGAWLFFSGNLLWLESRRCKQKRGTNSELPRQRRDTLIMAALTVGVCLGSVSGISVTIAAAKWLNGYSELLADWHRAIYYLIFFAAILWSLLRGAARASVELLWLAGLTTLLIPLTTMLGVALPSLRIWSHPATAPLAVDITALMGGLGFLWMARATTKRVYHGQPLDSLWSACRSHNSSFANNKTVVGKQSCNTNDNRYHM
jgi:uncharacterized iron-regulated membrane protein